MSSDGAPTVGSEWANMIFPYINTLIKMIYLS